MIFVFMVCFALGIQTPFTPIVHPKMISAAAVFFALSERSWLSPAG
jgi:hypothetical protein